MNTHHNSPNVTLALAITIGLLATPDEVQGAIKRINDFFDNGIAPTDINVGQTVSVAGPIPLAPPAGPVPLAPPAGPYTTHDNTGMPWDERIHSSSKALTDKGVWRVKRNLDKAYLAKTEGEIRATLGGAGRPSVEAMAALPPLAPAAAIPVPPAPAPAIPMPPVPGANLDTPFTEFVKFATSITLSPANPAGRVDAEWIKATLLAYGIADGSLQNLAHAPEKIADITAAIKGALGIQ